MDRRTRCARGDFEESGAGRPLAPVIVPAATFGAEDQRQIDGFYETGRGFIYSRYDNPTVRVAEKLLADLEGAERAVMFASGMAAISTLLLTVAGSGSRIAAQRELYGGTVQLLSEVLTGLGIDVLWLDRDEVANLTPERLAGCRVLYLETPVNPSLRLVDLRRAAEVAREAGVPVAVDSTFASPMLQRPLELGVDLVVHSATKYLGGHNDLIGGAVAGGAPWIERIALRRRALGGIMDPFGAFLLHRGMRTLAVRMDAHCRGAGIVARALTGHPAIEAVNYPGLPDHPDREILERQMDGAGGMLSFTVRGGEGQAVQVHDRLRLFTRAGSLGGVESLVSIPARMSHRYLDEATRQRIGVPSSLLRLSVGLEAPDDLVADLLRALG